MKTNPFATAAVLALILSLGLTFRIFSQQSGFRSVVVQSLATSEGYDQKFIDLVNHLEDILTHRASFAYPGGKDPMTGKRREVAMVSTTPTQYRLATTKGVNKDETTPAKPDQEKTVGLPVDRVKLTAIIADDYGQHTAIVMDGERSVSVDVGDTVSGRKVLKITAKEITMESEAAIYSYDISGNRNYQEK
jgi:hypothetical protein